MQKTAPSFAEFVKRWHDVVKRQRERNILKNKKNKMGEKNEIAQSCDGHFAPQIERCGLSRKSGLSQYDYVLVYRDPNQLADDTLKMLKKLGLQKFYYRTGVRRKEALFEKHSGQFSGANEKLLKYYTKETALLAYDVLKWDYEVLGLEFPFPDWL
ncbi:MAG: hypothetical protein GY928_23390 [Colwellia sp.]|nr:hypothetical protein [Colwellia sp.]